jgi:translation initiation factor 6
LPAKLIHDIESHLKIAFHELKCPQLELWGAGLVLTNRGFIATPRLSDEVFERLCQLTGMNGALSSANYGDAWIGNSVLANDHGAIAGENTSPAELLHMDEGLVAAKR